MRLPRRTLLRGGLGVLMVGLGLAISPTRASAEEAVFEYVPSTLGIDYRALAPSPLAEILSQGEVEWLERARADYAEDTEIVWKDDLAHELATGAISRATIEDLRDFTPQMLSMFAAGLDPHDKKYGGLWSVGTNYIASQLAGLSASSEWILQEKQIYSILFG